MANLQYIGARYVPKFYENPNTGDSTWKANIAYEPLTVVKYNDDSYTSRMTVPSSIGNPASNPDYWAKTADYNASIHALQEAVAENTSDIENLDTRVDALEAEKTEIIIIGDSWTVNDGGELNTNFSNHFPNCSIHNYGISGARFVGDNKYLDQASAFNADTSFDHNKIKFIVFVGGVNDYRHNLSSDDFKTYLALLYDAMYANLSTDVPFYWFNSFTMENDWSSTPSRDFRTQYLYYRSIQHNIRRKIIAIMTWSFINGFDTDNYFHPSAAGYSTFYDNVCRSILGSSIIEYPLGAETYEGTLNDSDLPSASNHFEVKYWFKDSEIVIDILTTCPLVLACPDNTNVEFSRNLPYKWHDRFYFGAGRVMRWLTENKFYVDVVNNTANTAEGWTYSNSGFMKFTIVERVQ